MTTDPLHIAILGCGPAGLFAAHAAAEAGAQFTIFSKNRKSFMRGAQYLHRPIPGLSGEPFQVEYELWGTVEGYRDKVYGDMGDVLVSPETLVGISDAWDIREAYDAAWELYGRHVVDVDFATMGDRGAFYDNLSATNDLVVSTIPAPLLCQRNAEHEFRSQAVWVTEGLKRPAEFGFQDMHNGNAQRDNLVVCSGDPQDWWYRQSRIHGWENTEFPLDHKPNFPGKVHEVIKPLDHTCTCHPDFVRAGRYGVWKKGVLSHEAFYDTARHIVALEQEFVS